MNTEQEPDQLDVVEHGAYSEKGSGPVVDTTGFQQSTPMGANRRPVDSKPPQKSNLLAREKLARSGAPNEAVQQGLQFELWHGGVAVALLVLVLVLSALLAVWLSWDGATAPAEEPTEQVDERPTEIDGIPVQRGIRR